MKRIVIAIHGILTGQTHPSWPDQLDAWLYQRDPEIKVLKKEYSAGPLPRLNCWFKNPRLAEAAAEEILLLAGMQQELSDELGIDAPNLSFPPIWLIAHSNGAHIALLLASKLIARGCWIGGIILTGAACEAGIERNGVLSWLQSGRLEIAIAYSSPDDQVLPWDHSIPTETERRGGQFARAVAWMRHRVWSALAWPYGSLGRTGWLFQGRVLRGEPWPAGLEGVRDRLVTRWQPGGHSAYFAPENIEQTFEQAYADLSGTAGPNSNAMKPD
jgi:pimeloyl-ACP methyl ester carboxylesterase